MQVNAFLHLKYVENRNTKNLRIVNSHMAITDGLINKLPV